MVVALSLVLGLAVAWMLGASPVRLADVRFRGSFLVFGALAIQLGIYTTFTSHIPATWDRPLHVASYLMLVGFFLINIRVPAFWLVGFGLLSNVTAIFANGGHMPVSAEAWTAAGGRLSEFHNGISTNNVLANGHTRLGWLGDVFVLPFRVPFASILSIGDLLIVLGTVAFVYRSCAPSGGPRSTNVFAPLRSAAFRRVIAGRLVSSVGDNLTQAAVVTWIYWSSRSVTLVSAFLVVRMLTLAFGGLASAPLLDRIPAFTTLSLVETLRGFVALLMIPFAAAGHVWPVIGLAAVSSFLAAATSPTAQGLIPDVLPSEQLQAGNAIHQMARSMTAVVGSLVGGLAVAQFSIQVALTVDLATFLLAALLYRRFAGHGAPVAVHAPASDVPRISRRELLRAILFNRVVFGLAASFTLVTAAIGILNSASSKVFDKQLGNAHAYGYILAVISVGYVCSEILTGYMRRQSVARRSVGLSFIATAGAMYILSDATTAPIAYLVLFLFGASDGITEVVRDSLIQLNTERRLRMGVFALVNSVQTIGMVVGLAIAPVIADHFTTGKTMRIVAAGCLVSGIVAAVCLVGGDANATLDEEVPADATPAAGGELGAPVPSFELLDGDGRALGVPQLAPAGPAVLVLAGRRADEGCVTMLRELAEQLPQGCSLWVVSRRDSQVGRHAEAVRLASWLRDASGACFKALRVADGRRSRAGGVFVVDGEGVLRFAFRLERDGDWIPASFVLSRLRRLAPAEPEVRIVRTELSAALEAIRPASEAA